MSEWNALSVILAGMLSGAIFNFCVYFVEWGKGPIRLSEILVFTGAGAALGAALFYGLYIMNKAKRR